MIAVLDEPSQKTRALNIGLVCVWPTETFGSKPSPGLATYARALSQILTAQGHSVTVFANDDALDCTDIAGVAVNRVWRANDLFAGRRIIDAVSRANIDVLHVQHELFLYGSHATAFAFPFWLDAIARLVPTVVTVHGVLDPTQVNADALRGRLPRFVTPAARRGLSWIFQHIARSPAHKAVHSNELRERLLSYGAAADTVSVVPLPHLAPRDCALPSRREARGLLNLPADAPVVLSWGFDNSYKGFDVLARGFEQFRLQSRRDDAVLLLGMGPHPKMTGSSAYMTDYAARANELASIAGIRFAGFIPEDRVNEYLAASDVAVFAYTDYVAASGPVSVALARGVPVLFSTVFSDVPEVLRFNAEPNAIANKLEEFFRNPSPAAAATHCLALSSSDDRVAHDYSRLYDAIHTHFEKRC